MAASIKTKTLFGYAWLLLVSCLLIPIVAQAEDIPPPAYQLAAHAANIPSQVLYAVALTESGMRIDNKVRPWPWTLNIAGKGRFFKTREEACIALTKALKNTSAKRVDVGLGQINYGYHGHRVQAPCDLLEPSVNLTIAAELLQYHHRQGEDWLIAIGRYHHPAGGEHANRYRKVVKTHLLRIAKN